MNAFNVGSESGRRSGDGIGYNDPDAKKKKSGGSKNKIPKIPTNKISESNSYNSGQQQQQQQMPKMPAINSGGRQQPVVAAPVVMEDEAGTGENAGPLNEWGFVYDDLALGSRGRDDSGSSGLGDPSQQEGGGYSDDEDFEPSDGDAAAGQKKEAKHKGKSHGKKKKKKQSSTADDSNNNYDKQQSSPRQQFSLPPI